MNPFNLPIEQLDKLDELAPVIKGSTFNLLAQANTLTQRAKTQALDVVRQANLEALAIQEKAAQLGEIQKSKLVYKVRDETRDAALKEALQWLIDEQQLEKVIIDNLEARVREIMASVVEEWFAEQDQVAQLAARLATIVRERAQQRPCKLRLPANASTEIEAQLKELVDLNEIECVADTTLNPEQAIIETEFLNVEFDLARHRSTVIDALRKMYLEEDVEDAN